MRADPDSIAIAHATMETVRARAGGRCEECGAADATPHAMLEGLPLPDNTLCLCDACGPRVYEELNVADMREFHRLVEEKLARAKSR